jgi:hypothetical protein
MQMRIEDGWVVVTLGEFEIKVPAEDDSGADERIEITAAGRRLWVELVDGELIATEPEPVIDLSPWRVFCPSSYEILAYAKTREQAQEFASECERHETEPEVVIQRLSNCGKEWVKA